MTLRVSVRVDADTAPLQDGLTRGSAALRGFGGEAARAGAATSQWAAEAQRSARMATAAQESHRAMAQAFAVTARAAAALGIALSTDQLIRYADTWKEVEGRLRLVTSGTAELMAVQERLFKVAQETRQGYEATADTYSRFARATQGLGVSQAQLLSVTETIGKAVTISGGSAASAEAALFQLGQAMAAGALRGEELNSVLEQAPRLAQAIAGGMGATVGQLRTLAEAGKLTAEAVLKALLSQGQVVSNEFAQLEPTVAQAFVVLQNAVVKYVGEADRASGATRTLSAGLMGLAGNMDSAMAGAGALGVALAGALAGRSFGPVIQGMVQTAAATAQATSAAAHLRTQTLAGAQASAEAASRRVAEVAAAQSQVTVLRESVVRQRDAATAQMELTRGMVEATGRTQPYTKALEARNEQTRTLITYGRLERQLTAEATAAAGAKAAADAAVVRAQGDIAAATARTGLAARAAAAASSLLSGALALVGGPVGAAILATAAAVAYLATRTSDAERVQAAYNTTMAEGRRRTEELGSASRGRANQLMEEQRNAVSAAHAEAAALRAKVAALRDEAAALRELSASNGGMPGVGEGANQQIAALQAKLAEAEARIRAAAAALDAMQSVSQTTGDAIGLELASKVGRGSSAVGTFASRLADALKAAGQAAAGSRILADEQAELEKYTQTLTTVINAGVGAFSKYGLSATEAANTLEVLRLKLDPVRRAIADLNAETNLLHIPEGFERDWAALVTKMSKGGERLLTPEEILDSRKDLADNAAAKLDDAAAKAQREALAQRLLAGALTDAAKAHANNRVALADMAAKYPGLGAETAKTLLTTRDFAGELAKLPPNFRQLWSSMQDSANSQLAGSMAQLTQGMTAETRAAELMALAAGKGEAAQRRARIEAQVYAAALQGHEAATRAAAEAQEAWTVIQLRAEQTAAIEEQVRAQETLAAAYAKGPAAVRAVELSEKARTLALKEAEEGTDAYAAAYAHYLGLVQKGADAERALAAAQAEQTARRDLSDAQAELALMREAEPIRARALESIRIQRQAVELFGDATSAAAQRWIALQEQIADTRVATKFWEDVRQVSEEVAGDIAGSLYDSLMDRDRATSVVDFFRSIFKRLAVEALKTQIVLPLVTQVVGSVPGLFGITSAGAGGATGQAAGATGGSVNTTLQAASTASSIGSLVSGSTGLYSAGQWIATSQFGQLIGMSNAPTSSFVVGGSGGATTALQGSVVGNTPTMTALGSSFAEGLSYSPWGIIGSLGASLAGLGKGADPIASLALSTLGSVGGGWAGAAAGSAVGTLAGFEAGSILGPVGAVVGAALGTALSGLFPADADYPMAYYYGSIGEGLGNGAELDGGDAAGMTKAGQAAKKAVIQLAKALQIDTSFLPQGGFFDNRAGHPNLSGMPTGTGAFIDYEGGGWSNAKMTDSIEEAVVQYIRMSLQYAKLDGVKEDVKTALKNSDAKTIESLTADLDFADQFSSRIKTMTGALSLEDKAREAGAAAAKTLTTQITDFKDTTKRLGLDVGAADKATRQWVDALVEGVDPKTYTAWEAALVQVRAQWDAMVPVLREVGYSADEAGRKIGEGLGNSTRKLQEQYQQAQDTARRQLEGRGYLTDLRGVEAQRATDLRDQAALGLAGGAADADARLRARAVLLQLNADQLNDVAGQFGGAVRDVALELRAQAGASAVHSQGQLLREAQGRGYLTQVDGLMATRDAAVAQLTALGQDGALALNTFTVSLRSLLTSLSADQLADVAHEFAAVGDIASAAADALSRQQQAGAAAAEQQAAAERLSAARDVLAGRVTTARGDYLNALTREQATLRDTASRLREVGASLSALRASLALDSTLSPLSAQARLAEAKRQLEAAVAQFRSSGDADVGAKAQQLMDSYLRSSREYHSSAPAYQADYDWVIGLTTELEGLATTTASAKDAQAAAMNATVAALGGTTSAVLSLTDALGRYTDALRLGGQGTGAQDFGDPAAANDHRIIAAAVVQSGGNYTGAFRDGAFARWAQSNYAAHDADQGMSASVNAMLRAATGYGGDFRDGAFIDFVKSNAVTELQREAARAIVRGNGGVPAFAAGGFHLGGLRLVGEDGPELEATGPSRIYSHQQTRDLLAPRSVPDLTPLVSAVNSNAITISRTITASGEATVLAIGQLAAQVAGLRAELADSQRQIRDLTRIVARLAA